MSRGSRKPTHTRLYRNTKEGKVMGVCSGIADYFGVDAWAVRMVTVVGLIFFMVPTLAGYFIAGALLEPKPNDLYADEEDEKFWRGVRTEPGGTIQDLKRRFADIDRRIQGIETYVTSKEFELNRDIRDLDA